MLMVLRSIYKSDIQNDGCVKIKAKKRGGIETLPLAGH